MNNLSLFQQILVWGLPILFGITLHEVAHGWVAEKLGDPTARMLGRITLNPLKHIDPIGTILVPALLIISSTGLIFGWAKPVPITWQNLKNKRRDFILVALAGPGANFLMLIFWILWIKAGSWLAGNPVAYTQSLSFLIGQMGVLINLMLMIFNLLPIPPLDGSRVIAPFLNRQGALIYNQLERFGFIILIILMLTGILGKILNPIFQQALHLISWVLLG